MTDLDRLREALERYRLHQAGVSDIDDIYEAARRFLALTETGRRVEWCETHESEGIDFCWRAAFIMLEPAEAKANCSMIRACVIPADYLTEEET